MGIYFTSWFEYQVLDGVGQFSVNMEVAQLNECKNVRTKYEDLTPEIPVLGLIFAGVTQHLCPV